MEQIDPFYAGGLTIRSAAHFDERLRALHDSLATGTSGSVVDEAKALLECVFRTIITDHNGEVAPGHRGQPTFPELYEQAKACINLSNDGDVAIRIDEACAKTVLIIGQIRNSNGATSHGQDAYAENLLGAHEAHFIAREALSIAALFLNRHSETESHLHSRLRFEDHSEFNEYVDDTEDWPVIFGQNMRPSEVLFNTDPTSYQAALIEYKQRPQDELDSELV
ncbi:hypothetical protein BGO17_04420 [Candidatus Saccharibacteria bacterium 49-20]|nr:MAG: hypothetical protein BGO17_04420 [Candidatus Saccharibacteria bacterium 49-20]